VLVAVTLKLPVPATVGAGSRYSLPSTRAMRLSNIEAGRLRITRRERKIRQQEHACTAHIDREYDGRVREVQPQVITAVCSQSEPYTAACGYSGTPAHAATILDIQLGVDESGMGGASAPLERSMKLNDIPENTGRGISAGSKFADISCAPAPLPCYQDASDDFGFKEPISSDPAGKTINQPKKLRGLG
jgi:hypothetical protein